MLERPTEPELPVAGALGFELLIVTGHRAERFRLPTSGTVTIGRGPECQLRIDDATMSRNHALLEIGERLVLRDLGSANGCHVGGRQLAPNESVAIAPGVVILLGGVTVVVQRGHSSTRLRHVRSHEYYEARVEDECARAEASKTTFSVARNPLPSRRCGQDRVRARALAASDGRRRAVCTERVRDPLRRHPSEACRGARS